MPIKGCRYLPGAFNILMALIHRISMLRWDKTAQQEKASDMIKFLTGSCLSELGIVLKEPSTIYLGG
jgi:hypothetical protein